MNKSEILNYYDNQIKQLEEERNSKLNLFNDVEKEKIINYLLSEGFLEDLSEQKHVYTKQLKEFQIIVVLDFDIEHGDDNYIDLQYTLKSDSGIDLKHFYSELYGGISVDKLTLKELKSKLKEAYNIHFKNYKIEITFKALSNEEINFNELISGYIYELQDENNIQINNTYYGEI